jgi:hypothetical protein
MPLGVSKTLTCGGNKCEALGNIIGIATNQTCLNFVGGLRMSRTVWFVWRGLKREAPVPTFIFNQ